MLSTTDILKDQQEIFQKMLDDNGDGVTEKDIKKYKILRNADLTPKQHKLAEYICAILYRLVSENKKLSDLDIANNIKVFLSAEENAFVRMRSATPYLICFGQKLFSQMKDLKKYKNTKKKGLYEE